MRAAEGRIRVTRDLAPRVDRPAFAVTLLPRQRCEATERPQIDHRPFRIQKTADPAVSGRRHPGHLSRRVDRRRLAVVARNRAEVVHAARAVQEGVAIRSGRRRSDDLASIVDRGAPARVATERAEVPHSAVAEKERVLRVGGRPRPAGYFSVFVERGRLGLRSAERPEVDDHIPRDGRDGAGVRDEDTGDQARRGKQLVTHGNLHFNWRSRPRPRKSRDCADD